MSRLEAIRQRREAAAQEVFGLCDGRRKWTMCVPVQQDDSDLTIMAALEDVDALLTVAEAARSWRAATECYQGLWRDSEKRIVDALDALEAGS